MNNYLVRLDMIIGEYEKQSNHAVQANSATEAGTTALRNECHDEPDFSDYPDKQSCWDCGEMIYKVGAVKELSDIEFAKYKSLVDSVFF
ncbi:hypothetical protein OAP32_00730 [Crocinitomicaceae bacterium]|nr:hypothetical protein [Crocinitomicaceae bacterium]